MATYNKSCKRDRIFHTLADKGDRRERFPLRWPNYTEDDIEEWITYTGCVWPDSACEVCRNSQCCPLFKILIGEF
jgi:hypothetical protein